MRTRLDKDHRREQILGIAYDLAVSDGLYRFDVENVAAKAECSRPLVMHYFGSVIGLREAIIEKSIDDKDARVVAQAIFNRDPMVDGLSTRFRNKMLSVATA